MYATIANQNFNSLRKELAKMKKYNIKDWDISPIFECLDGCDCIKGKSRCKLISDKERIAGETTFAEMYWKHIQEGGDPDVF
jgi:hypothetical protein